MITSVENPRVKWVRALQTKPRARQEEGLFVIEGLRLAQEAIAAAVPVRLVLYTDHLDPRGRGLVNSLVRLGAEAQVVSDSVMAACSATETPPGLLAVLPAPQHALPETVSLALVVDGLADPGNLGTILRTALAAGVQAIFLTQATVDAYNPKVVRAAMGAHFRLPIKELKQADFPTNLDRLALWLAEARAGLPYFRVDWHAPLALVIGSEASGPGKALRELATGSVHIPMAGQVESLNAAVAAAVILFEIVRQRGVP